MLDSERLTKAPLDYQVLKVFTDVTGAYRLVGETIKLDSNLGELLCRKGYLADVTARVADTITERVEDLESTATSYGTRITATEAVADAAATDTDLTLLENRVTTNEGDIATAQDDIDALDARVTTNEDELADHEERISTLEGLA